MRLRPKPFWEGMSVALTMTKPSINPPDSGASLSAPPDDGTAVEGVTQAARLPHRVLAWVRELGWAIGVLVSAFVLTGVAHRWQGGGAARSFVAHVLVGAIPALVFGMIQWRSLRGSLALPRWSLLPVLAAATGAASALWLLQPVPMLVLSRALVPVLAAWGLWWWLRRDPELSRQRVEVALPRTLLLALMILPLSTVLAYGLPPAPRLDIHAAVSMWLAAGLGTAALLPALLIDRRLDEPGTSPMPAAAVAILVLVLMGAATQWTWVLLLVPVVLLGPAQRLSGRAMAWLGGWAVACALVALALPHTLLPGVAWPLTGVAWAGCITLVVAIRLSVLAEAHRRDAESSAAAGQHVRTLMEQGPSLVALIDTRLQHRHANRNYLQWLGLREDDIEGQPLLSVFGEQAMAALDWPLRRVLAGQSQHLELVMPDGRTLDTHLAPEFSSDGPVSGFHIMALDSSWRGRAERGQRAFLDAVPDATALVGADGKIVQCNGTFEQLLDATTTDIVGHPLNRWLADASAEGVEALLDDALRGVQPLVVGSEAALVGRRLDRSEFPLGFGVSTLNAEEGTQFVVTLRDLTLELAAAQSLSDAHDQARLTVNAISDSVVVCDSQGFITAFNPMASQMSGWKESNVLGRPLDEVLTFVDPDSHELHRSLVHDAIRENRVHRREFPLLLRQHDGRERAVEESAAPIRDARGRAIGAVLLFHDVTESRTQAQTLAHQAQHDHLTGLPNRVLLQDRLTQALAQMERGYKGALLYLDLDKFKPINDNLGHPVGDRVLQEVATRLRAGVRQDDTVSRQGGDEFVLLLVRLADPRDAARVAEKLIQSIEQPIDVDGHELHVSASIGIALFPQDGRDTQTLMKQADTALYHSKESGRGRYSYVTDLIGASAEERMRIEHDLRLALAMEGFELAYQPRFELPSGAVIGMEALLRWPQPDSSVMIPKDFLSVAEETGLIVQIDEWVVHEACRQNCQWQAQGLPPRPVSVNVSLARFDPDRLIAHVQKALQSTGLAPHWLEIEFAGDTLFAQGRRGATMVGLLRAMDVRVAIDDFGAGHISLGEVVDYELDSLRIDRVFIAGLPDDSRARGVTRAILGVGDALGMRVVAKGVETVAQQEALRELGCEEVQGSLFSPPLAADRIPGLLRAGPKDRTG